MYDETWARTVFRMFWDSRPRAENLVAVISQVMHNERHHILSREQIKQRLLESLRRIGSPGHLWKIWPLFVKFVKKYGIDRPLLSKILDLLQAYSVDESQLTLFSVENGGEIYYTDV